MTVQEILEDRISKLIGKPTLLTAAGRTDSGVHAKWMTAHFDCDERVNDDLIFRLNSFLPKDIAAISIFSVKDDAHARFDALERTYQYHIHYQKDPFKNDISWYWNYGKLNLKAMNEAAKLVSQNSDFTSFARLHSDNKTNICHIKQAFWVQENDNLIFTITADRFLRNMVRSLVGTLVEIGQGKISNQQLIDIIDKKDRKFASASAPAHGLFLTHVQYPKEIFI